jgi:hypothetical protein
MMMSQTPPHRLTGAHAWDLSRLSLRQFAVIFVPLFALAALPVLLCDTLPLFDYPNHLARMHILAALPESAALQRYYEILWRPLPNLAMDLLVPPATRLMPLLWAGKGFVLLTFLLLAGGASVLHRTVCGTWSAWSCLAFLLLYNRMLLWGFLNYLFGLGLALFAFALWVALTRRGALLRVAVGVVLAFALFIAHLMACGLYGVLVIGYAVGLALRRGTVRLALGELLVAGISFVPVPALLLLATPGSAGGTIAFGQPLRKIDLLFSIFDDYNRPFDIACFALAAMALIALFWRRAVRLEATMAAPLALLVLAYLAMPSQLATASGADHRVPVLLALMLVSSSRWIGPGLAAQRLFLGAALLMFLIRLGVVLTHWQAADAVYAELLPALDELPRGGRLAVAYPPAALNSQPVPLAHFPTLAVVRRDAFVPTVFAFPTQQPVQFTPEFRLLADRLSPERLWSALAAGEGPPLTTEERAALARYDHIVFVARSGFALPPQPGLAPIFSAPRFVLCAIAAGILDDASGRR